MKKGTDMFNFLKRLFGKHAYITSLRPCPACRASFTRTWTSSPMLTRSDDLRILCVFFNFMRNYMPKQRNVLC